MLSRILESHWYRPVRIRIFIRWCCKSSKNHETRNYELCKEISGERRKIKLRNDFKEFLKVVIIFRNSTPEKRVNLHHQVECHMPAGFPNRCTFSRSKYSILSLLQKRKTLYVMFLQSMFHWKFGSQLDIASSFMFLL